MSLPLIVKISAPGPMMSTDCVMIGKAVPLSVIVPDNDSSNTINVVPLDNNGSLDTAIASRKLKTPSLVLTTSVVLLAIVPAKLHGTRRRVRASFLDLVLDRSRCAAALLPVQSHRDMEHHERRLHPGWVDGLGNGEGCVPDVLRIRPICVRRLDNNV